MNRLLLLILFAFSVSTAFSQNWRLFDPAREYYYGYFGGLFIDVALRIDSFAVNGMDTTWFPARVLANNGMDTCLPFIPVQGAFGERIVQLPGGAYDILYANGDTLHWQMNSQGPWRVLTNRSGGSPAWIEGTPVGYSFVPTLFGLTDSLLTVKLTYYDLAGVALDSFNTKVSKTLGWLQPIIPFPNASSYKYDLPYNLAGLDNPVLGIHNVNKESFFSMQPGDTIQTYTYAYSGFANTSNEHWIQDIYLTRQQSALADTLFFEIDQSSVHQSTGWPLSPVHRDTIVVTIPIGNSTYARLDKDFGEIDNNDPNSSAWVNHWLVRAAFPGRLGKPLNVTDYYQPQSACLHTHYGFAYWHDEYYLEGLGGPYASGFADNEYEFESWPTFFHVGNSIGGIRRIFDSTTTTQAAASIEIEGIKAFPNPATTTLHIDASQHTTRGTAELELIGANGILYLKRKLTAQDATTQLDVSALPRGLYIVKIAGKQGVVTRKILLQ